MVKCECLECIKAEAYERFLHRPGYVGEIHDNLSGKVNEFFGGKLVALKDVTVYSRPDFGTVVKRFKPGQEIGVIFSYVKIGDFVWWQIDGKNFKGFVKHEGGLFDEAILEQSLKENERKRQADIQAKIDARLNSSENPFRSLLNFSGVLQQIIIGVIVIVIAAVLFKLFK